VADTTNKDAFDLWWEWADKPVDSPLTIDVAIHDAVMALPPDERRDRAKVNAAVREGLRRGPLRPAGSEDQYGVPKATEGCHADKPAKRKGRPRTESQPALWLCALKNGSFEPDKWLIKLRSARRPCGCGGWRWCRV